MWSLRYVRVNKQDDVLYSSKAKLRLDFFRQFKRECIKDKDFRGGHLIDPTGILCNGYNILLYIYWTTHNRGDKRKKPRLSVVFHSSDFRGQGRALLNSRKPYRAL